MIFNITTKELWFWRITVPLTLLLSIYMYKNMYLLSDNISMIVENLGNQDTINTNAVKIDIGFQQKIEELENNIKLR